MFKKPSFFKGFKNIFRILKECCISSNIGMLFLNLLSNIQTNILTFQEKNNVFVLMFENIIKDQMMNTLT